MSVQGLSNVTAALKKSKTKATKGLRVGLFRAALFLQRESQKIVPVDTGALRASANTRMEGTAETPEAIVSYGQDYAVHVHENLEMRHKPGKVAKYLEKPALENKDKLRDIVMKAIKEQS